MQTVSMGNKQEEPKLPVHWGNCSITGSTVGPLCWSPFACTRFLADAIIACLRSECILYSGTFLSIFISVIGKNTTREYFFCLGVTTPQCWWVCTRNDAFFHLENCLTNEENYPFYLRVHWDLMLKLVSALIASQRYRRKHRKKNNSRTL